jgi:hypothetical protein
MGISGAIDASRRFKFAEGGWRMIHGERTSEERRESNRFPFIKFIRYDRGGILGAVEHRNSEREGAVINVSKDGVCLLMEKTIDPAGVIKIALPIPDVTVTTPTLAEIRWVKKIPWRESCFAGCRFLI